jgi:hypothetical protein
MVVHSQRILFLIIVLAVLIAVLVFVVFWRTTLFLGRLEAPGTPVVSPRAPLPSNPIPEAVGNPFGESGAYENPFTTPESGQQPYVNPFTPLQ